MLSLLQANILSLDVQLLKFTGHLSGGSYLVTILLIRLETCTSAQTTFSSSETAQTTFLSVVQQDVTHVVFKVFLMFAGGIFVLSKVEDCSFQ